MISLATILGLRRTRNTDPADSGINTREQERRDKHAQHMARMGAKQQIRRDTREQDWNGTLRGQPLKRRKTIRKLRRDLLTMAGY